ncbi:hypothetical protein MOQ72_28885 [Saccharopolyspora sp. K220]|uniref:hypothetical protein n=1 Tax=Saccharopolyspora soli TaxID=2926618 RepID=UPI001F5A8485|nr:hypothetical protein [Saccharopolyspora soli]MCI2421457.1 hypothetical protein [Saccharopolyspora soli]
MRSWLKWGLPLALVVLLGAAGGGVLLAQYVYRDPQSQQQPSTLGQPAAAVTSPLGIVYTSDAAAHPDYQAVQALLDQHFDSINRQQYERWQDTVVPAKWKELPKGEWLNAYDTTRDEGWTVQRIDPGPDDSLLVLLTFRSNQAIEDAPPQLKATCVLWNVVYPVVVDAGTSSGLRLDTGKLPNSALFRRC